MNFWTYGKLKQKVQADLDLQEESFITPDEFLGYVNEAIHEAESEILTINEDYFLTSATLALVAGTSDYALPTGVYAMKIRGLQYTNGAVCYPVKRIRGANKFDSVAMIQNYGLSDDYTYITTNDTAGAGSKIRILPVSRETGNFITIWYIRSAKYILTAAESTPVQDPTAPNNATQLATVIDIPEFITFIIDFVKCKCMAKDTDPRYPEQLQAMENQRKMMVDSLTQAIPDDDNQIVADMSFYQHSS
jgi:hypothetical protein